MPKVDFLKISLVICTYQRARSLESLLQSVRKQIHPTDEIIIVDGSFDDETSKLIKENFANEVLYYKVPPEARGLTRQRNFGISKVAEKMDIVAFVDDDTVLEPDYFEKLEQTFRENPQVGGVGGVAINENQWKKIDSSVSLGWDTYTWEGFYIKETLRNKIRKLVGLASPLPPFCMPNFSHVRASGYPLTGKFYEVDLLVGMSFAFRKKITEKEKFSLYFDGYGLYEDADYCIKALRHGKNVMDTSVQLSHFHHPSGRPNSYKYGKMVIRNGYYVWRLKFPKPGFSGVVKWHVTAGLLTLIRGTNAVTGPKRGEALREFFGRIAGWASLWFWNKPKPNNSTQ
ncbi:glycosyltransferase family 2 protein [Algoriphagus zhangzhouensis]|uniref:Glycosyltransferase, GT2 family n=1 Tax=Algoriphagus zhangzhouensis TaxID=1073327 RepID=A0A1M7ZHT2_9BACT|nr:glycosyltransferase family 2 protein [Algoriphagus zhangzhouensis]TDY44261.1 GT2 family glycosyltransferase [Algoriphagus zhangzhouensis]SHO64465.1 Glycosyltransferase, GT2 family [Algoriphagus zhangzhouensis]